MYGKIDFDDWDQVKQQFDIILKEFGAGQVVIEDLISGLNLPFCCEIIKCVSFRGLSRHERIGLVNSVIDKFSAYINEVQNGMGEGEIICIIPLIKSRIIEMYVHIIECDDWWNILSDMHLCETFLQDYLPTLSKSVREETWKYLTTLQVEVASPKQFGIREH